LVTWKQRLQGATLYALKFIKTIKSKENKIMENVFYKSYKELVSEYFGIDYAVDVLREEGFVWSDNQDRYINLDDEDFTFCENIDDFEESCYVGTCDHCGCAFSDNGEYVEVQGNYFCSDDCASQECVWSEYYSEYILIDDSSCCEDCGDYFYNEDLEEGSDGCLYCSDCIHDHLEDEEEIA